MARRPRSTGGRVAGGPSCATRPTAMVDGYESWFQTCSATGATPDRDRRPPPGAAPVRRDADARAGGAVAAPGPATSGTSTRSSAAGVRLVHLHFGFEHRDAADLAAVGDATSTRPASGSCTPSTTSTTPTSSTRRGSTRRRRADRAAGAVPTLTADGGAARSGDRYGAAAVVVAHPHVVPLGDVVRRRRRRSPRRGIYVHAATGRPNLDLDVIDRLAARPGAVRSRVHVRPSAPAARARAPRAAGGAAAASTSRCGPA